MELSPPHLAACSSAVLVGVSLESLEPLVAPEVEEEASAQRHLSCSLRSVRLAASATPKAPLRQLHRPSSLVKLRPVPLAFLLPIELPTQQQLILKLFLACACPLLRLEKLSRRPLVLNSTSQARPSSSHIQRPLYAFALLLPSSPRSPSGAFLQPFCNLRPHGPCLHRCYM